MNQEEKTCELDYKAYYDKHREEIDHLKMKLMDSEERCRILSEEVAKLSSIKATVEVIFGRKFNA
jgi:predicted RNase H-like nuclease (RuvC/YqgF family)